MLELQIERIQRSKKIDILVLATSQNTEDDPLEELCKRLQIPCFRGSLENVLERYYRASLAHGGDTIVRLTGDCPLMDWQLVDHMIERFEEGFDYVGNAIKATYPDGLDAEIFSFGALERSWREHTLPSHAEHVTQYIRQNPEKFRIFSYESSQDLSDFRWTVDEPEDFELVRKIYEALYPKKNDFSTADILAYIAKHPELKTLNSKFIRDEGLIKSLEMDKQALLKKELNNEN